MAEDQRFRKRERIRRRSSFAETYAAGHFAADRLLVVYVLGNNLPWSRLGLSVGRRIGGAVKRNRIRRRIREAFRKNKCLLLVGLDIVCVVKPGPEPTEAALAESLCTLAVRAARRLSPSAQESISESKQQPVRKPSAPHSSRPPRRSGRSRPR